jgi:hypothetical protein
MCASALLPGAAEIFPLAFSLFGTLPSAQFSGKKRDPFRLAMARTDGICQPVIVASSFVTGQR